MIPLKVIDSKTIEFDGDKYFGFDPSLQSYLLFLADEVNFPELILSERKSNYLRSKYLKIGFTEESWGFWKYSDGINAIELVVRSGLVPDIMLMTNVLFLPKAILDVCTTMKNKNDDAVKFGWVFTLDGLGGIPKWVKYCDKDMKLHKVGTPLPHALLRGFRNSYILTFLDKKAAERFKKEVGL